MLVLDFSERVRVYEAFARMSYAETYKEREESVSAMIYEGGSGKDTWIYKPMASDNTWTSIHSFIRGNLEELHGWRSTKCIHVDSRVISSRWAE